MVTSIVLIEFCQISYEKIHLKFHETTSDKKNFDYSVFQIRLCKKSRFQIQETLF